MQMFLTFVLFFVFCVFYFYFYLSFFILYVFDISYISLHWCNWIFILYNCTVIFFINAAIEIWSGEVGWGVFIICKKPRETSHSVRVVTQLLDSNEHKIKFKNKKAECLFYIINTTDCCVDVTFKRSQFLKWYQKALRKTFTFTFWSTKIR